MNFDDLLAEYLSAEEHQLHAQALHVAYSFHIARSGSKRARKAGDDFEGDRLDGEAEKLARVLEQVRGQR